jgi:hypothetical protein
MSRGMVKWNAFNALIDQGERLAKMSIDRRRQPKPILSMHQREAMDDVLQRAFAEGRPVEVTYYNEGFFHHGGGMVLALNPHERTININQTTYRVDQLTAITMTDEE